MDGIPLPVTNPVELWGAFGFVVALLIAIIAYLVRQNEKKDQTIVARDATIQAVRDARDAAIETIRDAHAVVVAALNDKMLGVYQTTTEKLSTAQNSSQATSQQAQQLVTTLQAVLDRVLAAK